MTKPTGFHFEPTGAADELESQVDMLALRIEELLAGVRAAIRGDQPDTAGLVRDAMLVNTLASTLALQAYAFACLRAEANRK